MYYCNEGKIKGGIVLGRIKRKVFGVFVFGRVFFLGLDGFFTGVVYRAVGLHGFNL